MRIWLPTAFFHGDIVKLYAFVIAGQFRQTNILILVLPQVRQAREAQLHPP